MKRLLLTCLSSLVVVGTSAQVVPTTATPKTFGSQSPASLDSLPLYIWPRIAGLGPALPLHPTPEVKDFLIYINAADSPSAALQKLKQVFAAQGYTAAEMKQHSGTLLIGTKKLAGRHKPTLLAYVTIQIPAPRQLGDDITKVPEYSTGPCTIHLWGDCTYVVKGHSIKEKAQLQASEQDAASRCFRTLTMAALAYPGAKVSYMNWRL